jgi:hypothetical protein
VRLLAILLVAGACAQPELATTESELTTAVRHERFGLIRDAAAEMGLYNAALLAGIAISETNLAHCQSEATYACKGPASSSCGGGPIIAGAADGPCTDMQGGLGMFQFDSGTYAQTVAAYGDSILTIEGNTAQAVNFVVVRAEMDIASAKDWMSTVGWLNDIEMMSGTPTMEEWASFIVCRYNGCCSSSSTCTTRRTGYRDNAIDAFTEMGAAFWDTSGRCAGVPADGVIDQRSECYIAGGDPRYWRRVAGGYGDTREWTGTTSASAAANFGRWIVKGVTGVYPVDVYLDGGDVGMAKTAKYQVVHAGMTETVTVDQTSASGWVNIGEFEFSGTGEEYVQLGDNTGEDTQLLFDAIRVLSPDAPMMDPSTGCCDSGGRGGATGAFGLLVLGLVLSRRRPAARA